jgi:hypothetical protein
MTTPRSGFKGGFRLRAVRIGARSGRAPAEVPHDSSLHRLTLHFPAKRARLAAIDGVILFNSILASLPRRSRVKAYLGTLNAYPVGWILLVFELIIILHATDCVCGINGTTWSKFIIKIQATRLRIIEAVSVRWTALSREALVLMTKRTRLRFSVVAAGARWRKMGVAVN